MPADMPNHESAIRTTGDVCIIGSRSLTAQPAETRSHRRRPARAGSLLGVVSGGVAVPGGAGVGVLAFGGGVVEAEGLGDDGGGCLRDELAEGGDPCGAHGESEVSELGEDGGVGGWLAWVAAGEQPVAGGGGAVGDELEEQAGEGFGDRRSRVTEVDVSCSAFSGQGICG
jgi:hypothetical protein